jgi:hypothetical protein
MAASVRMVNAPLTTRQKLPGTARIDRAALGAAPAAKEKLQVIQLIITELQLARGSHCRAR